jgi:D-alanine-D-alanine ligase
MRKPLKLTVLVDEASVSQDNPQLLDAPSEQTTEYHVAQACRELGHDVSVVRVGTDVGPFLAELSERQPDLVFNLTEEFRGDRKQDKNIAALLELIGLPFTGTGPTGLMLCRNKGLCKQLLSHHHVRVPGFAVLPPGRRIRVPKSLRYPVVVKPTFEDGSDGISNASLVKDEAQLSERVRLVHTRWHQPAIAEEYIDGRELYIGVTGNARLSVLPAREVVFTRNEGNGPVLATYRVKWDEAYRRRWGIEFRDARLEPDVLARVERACRTAYRVLQLRDYGRIDLRVTPENRIVILEVNANPDIAYGEEVAEAAERSGIPYNSLIDRILRFALKRYGN